MFTSCIPFLNLLLPPSTNQSLQIARFRNNNMAENGNEKGGDPSMLHGHAAYVAGAAKVGVFFLLLPNEHVRELSDTSRSWMGWRRLVSHRAHTTRLHPPSTPSSTAFRPHPPPSGRIRPSPSSSPSRPSHTLTNHPKLTLSLSPSLRRPSRHIPPNRPPGPRQRKRPNPPPSTKCAPPKP